MKISALQAYEMYLAIKAHFSSDYDFFKYKGRIKSSVLTYEKFATKNYYSVICKLANKYESKELLSYFISNMLVNNGQYIFEVDSEGKRIYTDYLRRKDSRQYIFKQDISRVCNELEKLHKDCFWRSIDIVDAQHPLLFRMFVGSYLSPETMCILYQINDYISYWDKSIDDTLIYPQVSFQIKKLSPFIKIKDYSPYVSTIDSSFNF